MALAKDRAIDSTCYDVGNARLSDRVSAMFLRGMQSDLGERIGN